MNINSQRESNKELSGNADSTRVQNRVHILEKFSELQQIIDIWPQLNENHKAVIVSAIKGFHAPTIGDLVARINNMADDRNANPQG